MMADGMPIQPTSTSRLPAAEEILEAWQDYERQGWLVGWFVRMRVFTYPCVITSCAYDCACARVHVSVPGRTCVRHLTPPHLSPAPTRTIQPSGTKPSRCRRLQVNTNPIRRVTFSEHPHKPTRPIRVHTCMCTRAYVRAPTNQPAHAEPPTSDLRTPDVVSASLNTHAGSLHATLPRARAHVRTHARTQYTIAVSIRSNVWHLVSIAQTRAHAHTHTRAGARARARACRHSTRYKPTNS